MILDHLRYRRRVSLLAFGALEGREREAVERHARACVRCRRELEELAAIHRELLEDPVRAAEPAVSLEALVARV
ncbi:MAG TPA: zf-HC2 domain-containing protein, partial [Vicinamibacteria bacterium]|nr:zf-HC2 domain-containing protein [Vicinamibacteria bacterium]